MSNNSIQIKNLYILITIICLLQIDKIKFVLNQETNNRPYDLSETNWPSLCVNGLHNSPIDFPLMHAYDYYINSTDYIQIKSSNYATITNVKFDWINNQKYGISLNNGGQTIISKNGTDYAYILKEISVKFLSEHRFNKIAGDLEVQLLHEKDTQYLTDNMITDTDTLMKHLVLTVIFKSDSNSENHFLKKLNIGDSENISNLNLNILVVKKFIYDDFYFYEGGLTYPNCYENVNWMVLKDFQDMSTIQFSQIKNVLSQFYPDGNARKVRSMNGRNVYYVNNSANNFLFFAIIIFLFYFIFVYLLLKKYFN